MLNADENEVVRGETGQRTKVKYVHRGQIQR